MIVVLKKGNSVKGLINYHERKVAEGKASILEDTTLSKNARQRISAFNDHALLNAKVRKHKFTHISISFPVEDQVSKHDQITIAERYLEKMGYSNSPRIIYRHGDTSHEHFHIVTSTITFEGRKINTFRDHYLSQEVSRTLEIEFGLIKTQYNKSDDLKLQEINACKFKILKGLQKLESNAAAMKQVNEILPKDLSTKILTERTQDSGVKTILDLRGINPDVTADLYNIFKSHNAFYKTDKQELIDRLKQAKNMSKNTYEFHHNCKKLGLYVRHLKNENSATVTYGLPDRNFYMRDTKLPEELRLNTLFKSPQNFSLDAQARFMKRMVIRHLKRSTTFADFESNLRASGIECKLSSNSGGVYGISFKSESIKNGQFFKGSELGLSWKTLEEQLKIQRAARANRHPSIPPYQPGNVKSTFIPKIGNQLDTTNDDEGRKRRKNELGQ